MTAEDIRALLGLFIADTSGPVLASMIAEFMHRSAQDRRFLAKHLLRGAKTLRLTGDTDGADAFKFCAGLLLWKNKEQASGQ